MGLIAALLMIVLAAFLLRSEWEKLQLEPVAYIVETEKKPGFPESVPEEGKLRLLFISDLHSWAPARVHPELLLSAVEQAAPDAVLIGGDMITVPKKGRQTVKDTQTALSLIGRLSEHYTVCFGEGNHERRLRERDPEAYAAFVGQLLALGVQYLADNSVPLRIRMEAELPASGEDTLRGSRQSASGIDIPQGSRQSASGIDILRGSRQSASGIDIPQSNRQSASGIDVPQSSRRSASGEERKGHQAAGYGRETGTVISSVSLEPEYYRPAPGIGLTGSLPAGYLEQKAGGPDQRRFNILLLHSPAYLKEAASWGADLVLSGHMHGGTIRLPGGTGLMTPQFRFFVRECSGRFTEGKTVMIVNRGLGTHSIKLRIHDLPELSVIDIVSRKAD